MNPHLTQAEREAYKRGYQQGVKEGTKKLILLAQLIVNNTNDFEELVIQNSKEVIELRKIMSGG
ncbi:MAG: hypothetical protein IJZ53_07405 [Tyzzerella sp.]|nr:hypothetical protein [Tyzzerella sp.]